MHDMVMLVLYGMMFAAVMLTFLRWGTVPADAAPDTSAATRAADEGHAAQHVNTEQASEHEAEEVHERVYAKAN